MNRAALSDALMSRAPASVIGWFAITPTGRPTTRPNPTMMFCA
jgi:hypothetical protein